MDEYMSRVAVRERLDGGISITRFGLADMKTYNKSTEDEFIDFYMNFRFPGESFKLILESDIPKDQNGQWDKSQRNEWSLKGDKVEVDPVKVAVRQARQNERQAIFNKMGITEEEFKKLKGVP